MNIIRSGMQGIHNSRNKLLNAADSSAKGGHRLIDVGTQRIEADNQLKASTNLIKTSDEILGSLLDIKA